MSRAACRDQFDLFAEHIQGDLFADVEPAESAPAPTSTTEPAVSCDPAPTAEDLAEEARLAEIRAGMAEREAARQAAIAAERAARDAAYAQRDANLERQMETTARDAAQQAADQVAYWSQLAERCEAAGDAAGARRAQRMGRETADLERGRVEAERQLAERRARPEVVEWRDRFTRRHMPARPAMRGDLVDTLGWECPSCEHVEPSEDALRREHGYDPDKPGEIPAAADGFGDPGQCHRARAIERQEQGAAQRAEDARALEAGATPAPWLAAPCPACDRPMRKGDLVIRDPKRKGGKVTHAACAPHLWTPPAEVERVESAPSEPAPEVPADWSAINQEWLTKRHDWHGVVVDERGRFCAVLPLQPYCNGLRAAPAAPDGALF